MVSTVCTGASVGYGCAFAADGLSVCVHSYVTVCICGLRSCKYVSPWIMLIWDTDGVGSRGLQLPCPLHPELTPGTPSMLAPRVSSACPTPACPRPLAPWMAAATLRPMSQLSWCSSSLQLPSSLLLPGVHTSWWVAGDRHSGPSLSLQTEAQPLPWCSLRLAPPRGHLWHNLAPSHLCQKEAGGPQSPLPARGGAWQANLTEQSVGAFVGASGPLGQLASGALKVGAWAPVSQMPLGSPSP